MIDPFSWLRDGCRTGALIFALALCMVLLMTMQSLDGQLKTEAAPHGIISYELAKTVSRAQEILASWNRHARICAAFSIGLDHLFLLVYAFFLGLACVQLGRSLQTTSAGIGAAGYVLAWGQFLAALCDVVENQALFRMLSDSTQGMYPLAAWYCAVVKFTLIGMAWVYILCSGFILIVAKLLPSHR